MSIWIPKSAVEKKPRIIFPRPWALGEEHESKTDIVDANNKLVCTIRGPLLQCNAHEIAELLIRAVNGVEFLE
jgi:hypothetical protein